MKRDYPRVADWLGDDGSGPGPHDPPAPWTWWEILAVVAILLLVAAAARGETTTGADSGCIPPALHLA